MTALQARFADMLARQGISLQREKGLAHCPFHGPERTPSLSIDAERCIFHCFGCGVGGGVRKFAELVGESWSETCNDSRAAKARRARIHAEQRAREILRRRRDERLDTLYTELRPLWREAADAVELLALFHRQPHLGEQFPDLFAEIACEYGDLMFQVSVAEARLDGEVE